MCLCSNLGASPRSHIKNMRGRIISGELWLAYKELWRSKSWYKQRVVVFTLYIRTIIGYIGWLFIENINSTFIWTFPLALSLRKNQYFIYFSLLSRALLQLALSAGPSYFFTTRASTCSTTRSTAYEEGKLYYFMSTIFRLTFHILCHYGTLIKLGFHWLLPLGFILLEN